MVSFYCSNARVNHNALRIMFGFLVPSYSPDTSIKLHGVTSQQGKHVTAARRSDFNHKQTNLFTDTLTVKLLTHTTIRYLNLQSHSNQILAEISRSCWVSYKMRSEVLMVVIMMLLVTSITLMMDVTDTLKCWCVSTRLHGASTESIFGVRSVWCAKDKQQQPSHL